jgi:hypothetical protein
VNEPLLKDRRVNDFVFHGCARVAVVVFMSSHTAILHEKDGGWGPGGVRGSRDSWMMQLSGAGRGVTISRLAATCWPSGEPPTQHRQNAASAGICARSQTCDSNEAPTCLRWMLGSQPPAEADLIRASSPAYAPVVISLAAARRGALAPVACARRPAVRRPPGPETHHGRPASPDRPYGS